jgi:predicted HicB family RNase H-like nuclease
MEDQVLHGKIEGIVDLITFESDSANEIEKEFHDAVDDYLIFCEEMGKEPNKAYKGSFNVRIEPQLHKKIALIAYRNGVSLNETIEKALKIYTNQELRY